MLPPLLMNSISTLVIFAVMMATKLILAKIPITMLIWTATKELSIIPISPKKAGKISIRTLAKPSHYPPSRKVGELRQMIFWQKNASYNVQHTLSKYQVFENPTGPNHGWAHPDFQGAQGIIQITSARMKQITKVITTKGTV